MFAHHKHSYLQSKSQIQSINPRILNRCVNKAREQPTVDAYDLEPPFYRLTSYQPGIPIENIDPTRRPVGFGRWAMPKLRRELHHPNAGVVLEAVTSISDLVHDPEEGYQAIKLRVPDRMADLLAHPDAAIRERTCMALTTIAGLGDGRSAIVKNRISFTNIAMLLLDMNEAIRYKAALLVEMISRTWMAADELVEVGYVQLLLQIVEKELDTIVIQHLESLKFLMYGRGKDIALEVGGFEIFVVLMEHRDNHDVNVGAATCLMMVTSTYHGKDLAYDDAILPRLNNLLHHGERDMYTAAASAITFCTVKSRAKIRASELLPSLADRLIQLTNDWHFHGTQVYAIKALTNICEHPKTRQYVRDNYCEVLDNIYVGIDSNLQQYKRTLMEVVLWVP